jgi:translation initiation factor 2 subunit 3
MNMKYITIIQNKIDLVKKEEALEQQSKIKDFTKYSIAENSPIVPISAQSGVNIDYVLE